MLERRRSTPSSAPDPADPRGGLVFARPDGRLLRPERVLNHFHDLTKQAGVPRCTLHGLRHLAVATAISESAGLWTVSRTARHSALSTTANIYAHVTQRTGSQAVDAIAAALVREEQARDDTTTTSPHAA
ncbi:tyrosine-type recombinase/integrase [Streptomyces reniochalinae]|nr:tyrosine-type recombinase/integrase [Streptomyces reniochalinae]